MYKVLYLVFCSTTTVHTTRNSLQSDKAQHYQQTLCTVRCAFASLVHSSGAQAGAKKENLFHAAEKQFLLGDLKLNFGQTIAAQLQAWVS